MEYDDDIELTRYVWNHYSSLMTEFERRVGRAIMGRMKAAVAGDSPVGRMLNRSWGRAGDPAIDAALADGMETYRQRVCRRVLAEYGAEVFVNRCFRCARVVRTPQARQCFWCGNDWHSPPTYPPG